MNEEIVEVFKNIERHLKNISISLCVMEERDRSSIGTNVINHRQLKQHYDFDGADVRIDWDHIARCHRDSSNS